MEPTTQGSLQIILIEPFLAVHRLDVTILTECYITIIFWDGNKMKNSQHHQTAT